MDETKIPASAASTDPATAPISSNWGQERRLEFIDFRLRWEKTVNRSDLTSHFGISVPQASLDIAKYTQLASNNLLYDRSSRTYRATPGFVPVVGNTSPQRYLDELLAYSRGLIGESDIYIGWAPPFAAVPALTRLVDPKTLSLLLDAVRFRGSVRINYQSDSEDQPIERVISPHAFAYDGYRWHVRAYCFFRGAYRDFVLGRILDICLDTQPGRDPALDTGWNTLVRLVIAANPQLTEGNRRAVERDYSMTDGETSVEVRQALLYYVLKQLALGPFAFLNPHAPQILLKNEVELQPFFQTMPIGRRPAQSEGRERRESLPEGGDGQAP
jgi:hypothetical protein